MSGLHAPEEIASANIMKNLQFLKQFTYELTNEKSSEIDMQEVGETIKETIELTYQTIFCDDVEIALQILDLLVCLDSVDLGRDSETEVRQDFWQFDLTIRHELQYGCMLSCVCSC